MMEMLVVMTLDGREMHLNPRHIVSIGEARPVDDPTKHYANEVRCVVALTDGSRVATREECSAVERRLGAVKK